MSGTPKKGLDYIGWSTGIFDSESSPIDELLDEQGWVGFGVYFFLCQRAAGVEGYFYRWDYKNAVSTARKMGGGVKAETVRQVVSLCLKAGLFDNGLFEREGILTNRMLQERYMVAIEKRSQSSRTVNPAYWLLSPSETRAYIVLPGKSDSLPENADALPGNATKESKANESKAKDMKAEDSAAAPQTSSPLSDRDFLVNKFGEQNVARYEMKYLAWQQKKGISGAVSYPKLAEWLIQDGVPENTSSTSIDMNEVMDDIRQQYAGL